MGRHIRVRTEEARLDLLHLEEVLVGSGSVAGHDLPRSSKIDPLDRNSLFVEIREDVFFDEPDSTRSGLRNFVLRWTIKVDAGDNEERLYINERMLDDDTEALNSWKSAKGSTK